MEHVRPIFCSGSTIQHALDLIFSGDPSGPLLLVTRRSKFQLASFEVEVTIFEICVNAMHSSTSERVLWKYERFFRVCKKKDYEK